MGDGDSPPGTEQPTPDPASFLHRGCASFGPDAPVQRSGPDKGAPPMRVDAKMKLPLRLSEARHFISRCLWTTGVGSPVEASIPPHRSCPPRSGTVEGMRSDRATPDSARPPTTWPTGRSPRLCVAQHRAEWVAAWPDSACGSPRRSAAAGAGFEQIAEQAPARSPPRRFS